MLVRECEHVRTKVKLRMYRMLLRARVSAYMCERVFDE